MKVARPVLRGPGRSNALGLPDKKLRARRSVGKSPRRTVRFGAPDASLTGSAGVLAVGELMDRLGVIEALDTGIGAIKSRARGLTGGQLVAALAQCQLLDGKFVAAVDRHRVDTAAQALSAVPAVASTTAGGLARRFTPARVVGIEAGNAQIVVRGWARLSEQRRAAVLTGRVSIDLDATDVEVYGAAKQGVAYNLPGPTLRAPAPGHLGGHRAHPGRGPAHRHPGRPCPQQHPAGQGGRGPAHRGAGLLR